MKAKENEVFGYILTAYPKLEKELLSIGSLGLPMVGEVCVADAVTKTVIGQMLSRQAAQTIYGRIDNTRLEQKLGGAWMLTLEELKEQGVSGRKAKAIREFGAKYDSDPAFFESWRKLQHHEVVTEVSKHWGLSNWTADILSIFYFGLEDVFPEKDGTIQRAVNIINGKHYANHSFNPNKASPYRTYLSLYLWQMIDQSII